MRGVCAARGSSPRRPRSSKPLPPIRSVIVPRMQRVSPFFRSTTPAEKPLSPPSAPRLMRTFCAASTRSSRAFLAAIMCLSCSCVRLPRWPSRRRPMSPICCVSSLKARIGLCRAAKRSKVSTEHSVPARSRAKRRGAATSRCSASCLLTPRPGCHHRARPLRASRSRSCLPMRCAPRRWRPP